MRNVRFQEVDLMGVVWHGRYVDYFEDGRVTLGKLYGIDYPDFFREEIKAPIVKLDIEYGHFLLPGDSFRIETSLLWTEAVRLNHIYDIKRESDGVLIARGSTVQLLVDYQHQLLMVWPDYFQKFRNDWKSGALLKKHE